MAAKKITVKTLGEDLDVVKEQVKEINTLKLIIEDLRAEVNELKRERQVRTEVECFACKKCESSFKSSKMLKQHILELHPKLISCKICEQSFSKNHELENHMDEHQVEKHFKCDICEKEFFLEWRLEKHLSIHSEPAKICKYFKSNTQCPLYSIGCKFKHKTPLPTCNGNNDTSTDVIEVDEEDQDVDKESSETILENQCHLCMKELTSRDHLLLHFKSNHLQFYTLMNNRTIT